MAFGNIASALGEQGGDPSFQEGGQVDVCELSRDHTPKPPYESLFQSTGEENVPNSQSSDLGGMRFLSE